MTKPVIIDFLIKNAGTSIKLITVVEDLLYSGRFYTDLSMEMLEYYKKYFKIEESWKNKTQAICDIYFAGLLALHNMGM